MARVFITGSADGLGHAAAATLLAGGHQVVVHIRSRERLEAVRMLLDQGAQVVTGDLSELPQMHDVAHQANAIGRMDAVIQNAGVYQGRMVLPVNVVAPYVLACLLTRPARMIFLSSGMHTGGHPNLTGKDWLGRQQAGSYSDSKLFVTALAAAIARRWPGVISSAVDPGWVPTRMGGPNATGDLRLGHLTQEWLATSDDARAQESGLYWHHQQHRDAHRSVQDASFQARLVGELETVTGLKLAAA